MRQALLCFIDRGAKEWIALRGVLAQAARYLADGSCPVGEQTWRSAYWSAQSAIAGAQALRTKRLPPVLYSMPKDDLRIASGGETSATKAIVSACGLNQQAAGLRLSI